jgi:hypothetical protein
MDVVFGTFSTVAIGVLIIAGIYQLSKGKAPLVTAGQSVATTTLSSIFK